MKTLLRRRGLRYPILMLLIILVVPACGGDAADTTTSAPPTEAPPVPSDDPPYGLTELDLPSTETGVIAVLEALPAIDGRQPTITRQGDWVTVVYEGAQLPVDYWSMSVVLDVGVDREWFMDGLSQQAADPERGEGWTLEASALDPNGDLVWTAAHWMVDDGTGDEMPVFEMFWADPSDLGPSYSVFGNTADMRRKLVHAFINAASTN